MAENRDEHRFAYDLIDRRAHADKIEFEIEDHAWDSLRLALELNGYSVHRRKDSPGHVVAFRVEPDRAPVSGVACVM